MNNVIIYFLTISCLTNKYFLLEEIENFSKWELISENNFKSLSKFNNSSSKYTIEFLPNIKKTFFFEIFEDKCEIEILYFSDYESDILKENIVDFNFYNSENELLDSFSLNQFNKYPLRKKLNLNKENNKKENLEKEKMISIEKKKNEINLEKKQNKKEEPTPKINKKQDIKINLNKNNINIPEKEIIFDKKKNDKKKKGKYKLDIKNNSNSITNVSIHFLYKGCVNPIDKLNLKDLKKLEKKIKKMYLLQKVF